MPVGVGGGKGERGISSELADMTCCEQHLRCRHRHCRRRRCCRRCCCCFWSSFSFSFLFLFVLSLPLSLSLLSSLSSLSSFVRRSSSVVGTIIVVSVVVAVVVIGGYSCCCVVLLLLPLLSLYWVLFANPPKIVKWTFFANPKKRQIGGAFAIFHLRGTKKHRKYQCFWLRHQRKTTGIYEVLSLCEQKSRYLQCFVARAQPKHCYLRSFLHVGKSFFLDAKGTKNIVNYTIFTRGQYQKNRKNDQKSTKKRPTRTSKTHLQILPSFSHPEPTKNVKTPAG